MEHFLSVVTNEWTKTWREDVSQPGLWTQAKLKAAGTITRWRCTIRRGWQDGRAWTHFLKLALQHKSQTGGIKNNTASFWISGPLGWSLHSSRDLNVWKLHQCHINPVTPLVRFQTTVLADSHTAKMNFTNLQVFQMEKLPTIPCRDYFSISILAT